MKYKCVKTFSLEIVDDDGSIMENSHKEIHKGSVWERVESSYRFVGAPDSVRLENDSGDWMELSENTITNHFAKV